eukprot:s2798_g3.t1
MATAESRALDELRQIQEFLASQQGLIGADAVNQQALAWQNRLSALSMTAAVGRQFADLIRTGPWTNAQQTQLGTAVNSSVLRASAGAPQGHRRQLQEALDFIKYFSEKDLEVLSDNQVSTHQKLDQIVTRLIRLKLHLPSEPTTRHILAVAMSAGLHRPTATDALYNLHKELKRMLKAAVKAMPRSVDEHIVKYPSNPADLPPNLLATAYDQGDSYGRLAATTVDLAASTVTIPLRLCNRNLKGTQIATASASASSPAVGTTPAGSPMEQCAAMMMNFMMHMCNQGNQQHAASLTTFKPPASKRRAIGDGSPDSQSSPPKQDQLALPDQPASPDVQPHAEAASVKAAVAETPTPPKAGEDQLKTPPLKALTLPDITPENQIAKYNAAVKTRQEAKQEVKNAAEAAADSEQPDQNKPGAKSKAKAKAKAKAKGEPKAKAKTKASASKAESKEEKSGQKPEEPPCKKAKVVPKEERVIYDLENKPAPMQKGSPTVWYLGGKIHCNGNDYRVFLRSHDRNDRKVRVQPSPEESWEKCLKLIEEAHAEDQKIVD